MSGKSLSVSALSAQLPQLSFLINYWKHDVLKIYPLDFSGLVCFLPSSVSARSNIQDCSAKHLWSEHIQSGEAKAAFRIHRSDLGCRPSGIRNNDRVRLTFRYTLSRARPMTQQEWP